MKNIKIALTVTLSTLLCACNGFFDKDNTPNPFPLVNFTPETNIHTVWNNRSGSGVGNDYLKLVPAVTDQTIFTASTKGTVTATNKLSGKRLWEVNTRAEITGGPGANKELVFVGSREGDVLALRQSDGGLQWTKRLSSEILAAPASSQGVVLVKTIDGKLFALSDQDGHELWNYLQTEPALILRGSSAPKISHDNVVVGFANGNLARLSLHQGTLHWEQAIALPEGSFAIQRMIDIDADPIIFNNKVYAATYQGRISSLDLMSGKPFWTQDISSYTGIAADSRRVYVSDAKSHVWAFDVESGAVNWRQQDLESRNISGPASIGNYVVVGDAEGYLHFLNKQDGHFVARVHVSRSGILATPVVDNGVLYVLTQDGHLAAYTIG